MTYIREEPPDDNEAYESLDEHLDEQDLPGHGPGPEGGRDIEDLTVDQRALQQAGADLDDPDRISLLDGAMDDPDGSAPPARPAAVAAGEGSASESEPAADPELEIVDVDATDMDRFPEDAPGPDSARW
jgi:hypothetical protein